MQANGSAPDLSRRLAALSPEARVLLQKRLVQSAAGGSTAAEEIPLQARGERRDFPLSSAQERMWFNHQWRPDQPLYNESFGLNLKGDLKLNILRESFDLVMARHEIFTVTFHADEGQLFQRLGGCAAPQLEAHDLREFEEARREAAYRAGSERLLREPFRLEDGPLFRAGLWTMTHDRHRLIFVIHHIIFDGWSGAIFYRELFTTYSALIEGREPDLPPLGAQYVDFAAWEQTHFKEAAVTLDRQLEYWKKKLEGAPAPPQLPVDHHVRDTVVQIAGREVFVCPPESTEALKKLAKESGVTLFMALLAIFKLLLARYSGQEDIVLGLPTINRNQSTLGNMIGVFINTVILRTDVSGDATFREMLDRVRKTALEAQANQELPFERIVSALDLKGDAGRSLIHVMFDLQKKLETLAECPGLTIQSMDVGTGLTKFELVLAMEDTGSELKGVLDYAAEKFDEATAHQFARHFVAFMNSAVAQPDVPAKQFPIMTSEELAQLVVRGKDTSGSAHSSALFETGARALEHPEALALVEGDNHWSYRKLQTFAGQLAAFLRGQNIGRGQHVALVLPGGADLVTAELAVMMAGAAFVPIDPTYPAARVAFLIQDCDAKLVIAHSKSRDTLPVSVRTVYLDLDRPEIDRAEPVDYSAETLDTDPAYVIYTSGSTGQPKGVSVSHGALANLIAWHRRAFDLTSADRATQLALVGFDASIWEIWPYLASGASVHFAPRELIADPAGMRDWLVKNKITISFAPTPLAEEMIELEWPSKVDLRFLLTGGDRLRKRPSRKLPFQVVNNYGPTENAVVATSGLVSSAVNGSAPSIGSPIDNVWARIVDGDMNLVPLGVAGELIVGGRSLAIGYHKQPALTLEKFVTLADGERAYRTGDLCRFRRSGEIEFLGRLDTQVKVRGCRIELSEIENVLLAHDAVCDAVVELRDFVNGNKQIVAYIVPRDLQLTAEALRNFVAKRSPSYMVPSCFVMVDAIPKTPNGKVDRKKLPSPEANGLSRPPHIEPRNPTESELVSLWKNLLNVDVVGVRDDFFQLGGDSLMATRLAVTIRNKFGRELPLARMLSAPTIEALGAYIDGTLQKVETLPSSVILLKSGGDSLPPLFLTPPASGSPACYASLVSAIQGDRAVYGFEAPGLVKGKPVRCFKAVARKYVEALVVVQPEGPYHMAGWSLGGPVAFEMACQLREAGHAVAYLGMIDAALPENGRLPGGMSVLWPLWCILSYPFKQHRPLNYRNFSALARSLGLSLPDSLNGLWRRGFWGGCRFTAEILANAARFLRVVFANLSGLKNYQPQRFDGEVSLYQTALDGLPEGSDSPLVTSLSRWARRVKVYDAPGSHMTLVLDHETVTGFAPSFEASLNPFENAAFTRSRR